MAKADKRQKQAAQAGNNVKNDPETNPKKTSTLLYLGIASSVFVFVQTFSLLSSIYLSFILTLLIALALNPLVSSLRTTMGGRKGATALVVFLMISVLSLSGWAFYIPLRDSVSNLSEVLPESSTLRSSLAQMLGAVVGSMTNFASNGAQILLVLVTVFFGVIFMLMNPRPIISSIFSLVPVTHHDKATAIIERICRFAPAWGGSTLAGMLTIGL